MENQIYRSRPSSPQSLFTSAVKDAIRFLQNSENVRKKWHELSYPETILLVKALAQAINPDSNLEGVSLEGLTRLLTQSLTERINIETQIPRNLQTIFKKFAESPNKPKIYSQKAALETKDLLKSQEVVEEFQKRQLPLIQATSELSSVFTKKLTLNIPPEKRDLIAQAVAENLPVKDDLELSLKKTTNLPPEKRELEERKIIQDLKNSLKEAVPQVVEKLQNRGIKITPQEEEVLLTIEPSNTDLILLATEFKKPPIERNNLSSWFKEQLSPVLPRLEGEKITQTIALVLTKNLPEVYFSQKASQELSEEKFLSLKEELKQAVILTLVEVAPELGEIPAVKIPQLISALLPQDKKELQIYLPILNTPKRNRVVNLPLLPIEPVEATQLPSKFPRFFASPMKRATEGNPLYLTTEKGIKIVDEIKKRLFQEGINKGNALGFRSAILRQWAIHLTSSGITKDDLEYTKERLLITGEKENSPRIKELEETAQALTQFQQTQPLPLLEKVKKAGTVEGQKGNSIVPLPSRYGTIIIRKTKPSPQLNLPSQINFFLGKLFGKQKIAFGSGQIISINKIAFNSYRFFEGLKKHFFQTVFGQGVKNGLQQLAQKSLQTFWTGTQIGLKRGISTILSKIGLQSILTAITPGIGNLLALVLPKLIKRSFSLVHKGVKLFTSGFGIFDGIMSGITGQREVPESNDFKWIAWIFIGLFIFLFFGIFMDKNTKNAAMLQEGGELVGSGEVQMITVPLQCQNPRHLAEETVCKLTQGEYPCNQSRVNQNTWHNIDACFDQISLPEKNLIRMKLYEYLFGLNFKSLQCVGFVKAIQWALGKPLLITIPNAEDLLSLSPPQGYKLIDGSEEVKEGDISVWKSTNGGHMAIVIDVEEKKEDEFGKIIVAQSWGTSSFTGGAINLTESYYGQPGKGGCPEGFLRYTGK